MRIMSWNLWWKFGPYLERQAAIGAEIENVDPDVLLCQEVFADDEADQAEALAQRLGFSLVRSRDLKGEPQPFGNSIMSRWPLVLAAQVSLPNASGGEGPRTAIAAWAEGPGGRQLIVNTHLDWDYAATEGRQRQLETIVKLIVDLVDDRGNGRAPNPAPPPILGGDFNALPSSDEVRRLTGESTPYVNGTIFTDSWAAVGDGPGHTWTRENPHADNATFPRRRLDYVMIGWPRKRPFASPLRAYLAGVEPVMGIVPSDHYAVVVDLDERSTI